MDDTANKVILLDIDGVLNEAQQPVSGEMQRMLQRAALHYPVYFVTGNNYTRSVDILNGSIATFMGIFCNNADELRTMRGKLMWRDSETNLLPQMQHFISVHLGDQRNNSIEWRTPRMVNVSKVGRFATLCERQNHDASWRDEFMNAIKCAYPEADCAKGGAVSVDIFARGADKSRAAAYINSQGREFIFIGDKTSEGGNDFFVKEYCSRLNKNICLTSNGPDHTMEMLDKFLT